MLLQVDNLLNDIKTDYAQLKRWTRDDDIRKSMIQRFNDGLTYAIGKKYIKIIQGGGVWGFIVNTDNDKKFRKGDILKAVSWASPARNKARGNILDGDYDISWTGPNYLR